MTLAPTAAQPAAHPANPAAAHPAAAPLTVMGAGLVGSLLALYLARRGHAVQVFERRPDPRLGSTQAGRSINLALSDRGFRALEGVGAADAIREVGIAMTHRVMHDKAGHLTEQAYGQAGQAIYSVNRGHLNRTLLTLAEAEPNVRVAFGQQCQHLDLAARQLHLRETATGRDHTAGYARLFGTDGAFSAIRSALQRTDRYDYSQDFLEYGYKELTIEAGPGGTWAIAKHALHIWPRGRFMMIALPNLDGSFNATLYYPFEGPESFAALDTPEKVQAFFEAEFADAVPLMPNLLADYAANPTASLVTVRCYPWQHGGDVLLLGDASHAIVPFYGQGMNAGFEDCTVLNQLLDAHGDGDGESSGNDAPDWPAVFAAFERERKPNADAMADLALYNFVEMRDRVADPRFLLQKKVEAKIAAQFPGRWTPLYTQVTFSHTPYAQAWANGQRQDGLMARLMPLIHAEADYDTPAVQALAHELIG